MKILYCITRSDTLGGAHIHVADVASWARAHGHDASVIVGGEGPFCDHLSGLGVPYQVSSNLCRPIRPLSDLRAIAELRRMFRGASPDLISLHSAKAGLLGRLAALGLKVPVVFTAHGWSFTEGVPAPIGAFYRTLERLAAPLADRIITVSHYDRLLAISAGIRPAEKIVAIHNAMPDKAARADPGRRDGPPRIVMVARLDNPKDHGTLLAALAGLIDREWIVDLIGDGPLEDEVKVEIERRRLADRVQVLGLRSDVGALLGESQVFVLTTHWEGLPRSILEAMRAGLPVIATDVGGIPESVVEGSTGYLVPRHGADVLRDRLAHLLDHPEERLRLGNAGRQRFEEHFRFERLAEETWAVYRELVGERACASA